MSFEKEDVSNTAERSEREEVKVSIKFSEMDIIDDINESNLGGVRGSKAKNSEAIGRNSAIEGKKRECNI